ncbi:MAG: hypothetical protein PHC51_07070 [bacterium]|nr:hypothetical protein [bacterium]
MKKLRIFWLVVAGLTVITCPLNIVVAQEVLPQAVVVEQVETPTAKEESPQEKAQGLAVVVEQEMKELAASLKLVPQDSGGSAAKVVAERQIILERTRLYLEQLIATFKKKEQLALETAVMRKELERALEVSSEKIGFAEIDTLRDKLFLARDNQRDIESRIDNARVMFKEAAADFEKINRQRRAV